MNIEDEEILIKIGFFMALHNMKSLINGTAKSKTINYLKGWYENVEKHQGKSVEWLEARDIQAEQWDSILKLNEGPE